MKIALVNLGRVNNSYGGTEKVFFDMANNLSRRGHCVSAIVHDSSKGDPPFPLAPSVRYMNYMAPPHKKLLGQIARLVLPLFFKKDKRKIEKIKLRYKTRAIPIKRALEETNPDIIVTFQPGTSFLLLDIIKTSIPVVSMLHFTPLFGSSPEDTLIKNTLKKCSCIQILEPDFIDILAQELDHRANIVFIPNIVPQYKESADYDSHLIINVARVERVSKRQLLIVKAFSLLKNKFPDWRVEIWGETTVDPSYTQEINNEIKKEKLESRVFLKGTTKNIPEKLKKASIFCFPSATEGMPLAMTEAMSMGLPVVGYKGCPSVNKLIRSGENGYLCGDTPQEIAEELDKLMANKSLREHLGTASKIDMKKFSPNAIWDEWEKLLSSILDRASKN